MYTRLTKVIKDENGNEFIVCKNFGTEKCLIHRDDSKYCDCARCPVLAAMLNQLYEFENIVCDNKETK